MKTTYNIQLDRFCRGQVYDLELLSLGQVPLREIAGQLSDAFRTLRGCGLVIRGQILNSLQSPL